MNIIFLDVDGVLNSIRKLKLEYFKTHKPYFCNQYPFDEEVNFIILEIGLIWVNYFHI